MVMPIKQSVKTVSIQPMQLDHKVEVGADGAITRDNQTIGSEITVFYKYKPDQIVNMYKNYGEDKMKSVITQTLRETFKTEIGNYAIFDLPSSQTKIQGLVYSAVVGKMKDYPVDITELKIVNYDWSPDFDAQIKDTMSKAQQVKGKEQEKLMAEQEAQKGVVQAEAQKKIAIANAEGQKEAVRLQAEAKVLEGNGIKAYNDSIAKNWDIELKKMELEIAKIRAEKWNGVNVSANNYGPIPIQSGSILGEK
jgi:regulator of protease activity HflC (stomatin/prohibitin superfamily)